MPLPIAKVGARKGFPTAGISKLSLNILHLPERRLNGSVQRAILDGETIRNRWALEYNQPRRHSLSRGQLHDKPKRQELGDVLGHEFTLGMQVARLFCADRSSVRLQLDAKRFDEDGLNFVKLELDPVSELVAWLSRSLQPVLDTLLSLAS